MTRDRRGSRSSFAPFLGWGGPHLISFVLIIVGDPTPILRYERMYVSLPSLTFSWGGQAGFLPESTVFVTDDEGNPDLI